MDLSTLDMGAAADRGATMTLMHPVTGAPLDVTMTVLGQDASAYRAALRRVRDAIAAKPEAEPTDTDAAFMLAYARDNAAAVTGWSGVEYDGKVVPFSYDSAVDIMRQRPWIAEQVAAFRMRRANFFKG